MGSAGAGFGIVSVFFLIIGFVALIAWFIAISMFVNLANDKGHHLDDTGKLWFVGIFASPIVLGIYVLGLRDKKATNGTASMNQGKAAGKVEDDLPAL